MPIRLIQITSILILFICTTYEYKPYGIINHDFSAFKQVSQSQKLRQKDVSKNTASPAFTNKAVLDSTFKLKIENEKRVVDTALKTRLNHDLKEAIARHHLKKPYKIAMGFTRGARDVETFLFGEQIFYTLAESGYSIKGTPLDMPDEKTNPVPQIKVIDTVIYVVLSKM